MRNKFYMLVCFTLGAFLLGNPPAAEAALDSPDLTITTYNRPPGRSNYYEGHLISFPYSTTTLSIDCASGTITTLSHGHGDHCSGGQQWTSYNVHTGQVLYNDVDHGVKVTVVAANGHAINGGRWSCSGENEKSMALWVRYGGFDFLTAGDMYGDGEGQLGDWFAGQSANDINIDVLKLSHHGTTTNGTSSLSYFRDILPEFAVACGTATGPGADLAYRLAAAGVQEFYYAPWIGTDIVTRTNSRTYTITAGGATDGPFPVDDDLGPTPTPTPIPTPSPTPTLIPGEVIINEILAMVPLGPDGDSNGDGVRHSSQDEFIELVNWTNHAVNLGGCTISDSRFTRFTFSESCSIPSGKALVLFGGGTPIGLFGGAITLVASTQSYYGLGLTDTGDTVTLRKGDKIYDRVTYGQQTRSSYNRWPEIRGSFKTHNLLSATGRLFSPGTKVDGSEFEYEPTPTPAPSLPPNSFPTPDYLVLEDGDYDGDGTADIAIYRNGIGLWAVKGITRLHFGSSNDLPVPADYDGDGTTDIAVFKTASGLWAIRGLTRLYFGLSYVGVRPLSPPAYPSGSDPYTADLPVPADYDGDGSTEIAVFRESSGLWAVRYVTRLYFGSFGDVPVPGDYNGDGKADPGIFREGNGLWAIKLPSWTPRRYFGGPGDRPVAGDYAGNGIRVPAVFRESSGLWAIRNLTRCYFGNSSDRPVPADYNGDGADDLGVFRSASGLWAVRGVTRAHYGSAGDFPVTR